MEISTVAGQGFRFLLQSNRFRQQLGIILYFHSFTLLIITSQFKLGRIIIYSLNNWKMLIYRVTLRIQSIILGKNFLYKDIYPGAKLIYISIFNLSILFYIKEVYIIKEILALLSTKTEYIIINNPSYIKIYKTERQVLFPPKCYFKLKPVILIIYKLYSVDISPK